MEAFGRFLPGTPNINVDNEHAGELCTRHLLDLGHRRIGLLTHNRYENENFHYDAWNQYNGYRSTLESARLKPMLVGGFNAIRVA